jgi:hypothetical protein
MGGRITLKHQKNAKTKKRRVDHATLLSILVTQANKQNKQIYHHVLELFVPSFGFKIDTFAIPTDSPR